MTGTPHRGIRHTYEAANSIDGRTGFGPAELHLDAQGQVMLTVIGNPHLVCQFPFEHLYDGRTRPVRTTWVQIQPIDSYRATIQITFADLDTARDVSVSFYDTDILAFFREAIPFRASLHGRHERKPGRRDRAA